MVAHYFNSSCKGQEFKQKSQHAVKLLFCAFIALLIILQSLPYLQFLPTVIWLDFDLYLFPLTKMLGKALHFRDATGSSCSLSYCLAAVGISPAPHELTKGIPAINFQSTPAWKHWQNTLLPAAALKGFQTSDAFSSFCSTTRTFPSICGSQLGL